jgi:hypothetical protein
MRIFKKRLPLFLLLLGLVFSCGLPTYSTLDPPDVEDTDDEYSLAFTPDSETDNYILAYKIYWDNEDEIDDDEDSIDDDDDVESGFGTLEDLDFIQMATDDSDTSSDSYYPDDSTDVTIEADSTVTITFDTDTGQVSVTGADNTDVLYRRILEFDSDGDYDDDTISTPDFVSNDYDYQDYDSYTTDSVTISGDSDDGIDSDVYYIFTDEDRFIGSNYDLTDITIAVVAYSYGLNTSTFEAEESVPAYLGTVSLSYIYWNPSY